jgi:hypothetical protein
LESILAGSTFKWTKSDDAAWSTEFKGEHVGTVTVYVSLIGDLVVSQSLIANSATLNVEQMAALLRINFTFDLVKLALEGKDGNLIALNETELRLLDGASVKRIVDSVAVIADDVGGTLTVGRSSGRR